MSNDTKEVTLNPKDLATMISAAVKAAVEEVKKPSELEQLEIEEKKRERQNRQAAAEQANEQRKQNAELQRQTQANKKFEQSTCPHSSSFFGTRLVFVHDELGGYVMCQKCQVIVRPIPRPLNYSGDENVIFDQNLFNQLVVKTRSDAAIID